MPMWWKWGEWHRHCDEALGYYWPDDTSEREPSASGSQLIMDNWNHRE